MPGILRPHHPGTGSTSQTILQPVIHNIFSIGCHECLKVCSLTQRHTYNLHNHLHVTDRLTGQLSGKDVDELNRLYSSQAYICATQNRANLTT